jgi:hypothetical protein
MNVITDTLRQLVQRKLWPVAVLLVTAMVAVPVVLAKEPAVAPAAPAAKAQEGLPATFVSAVDEAATEGTEPHRVLGEAKDPFEPAPLPKAKKTKKKAKQASTAAKAESTPAPKSSSGGTSADAPGATAPPVSPAPGATPAPTSPLYSIKVRFGTVEEAGGELKATTVERLSVLPDAEKPVLVYRGVADGGKVAVFELTGAVVADGDGTCAPTPVDCQYLKLRAGETEFITVTETGAETDAQYQLDLVKINSKKTTAKAAGSPSVNSESLAKASSAKLKGVSLRKRNRYVFDETTGTLRRAHGKTPSSTL